MILKVLLLFIELTLELQSQLLDSIEKYYNPIRFTQGHYYHLFERSLTDPQPTPLASGKRTLA